MKVFRTTIYTDERFADSDKHITQIYKDEIDMEVSELLFALEGYVVNTTDLVSSKKDKLMRHLKNKEYMKYYKTIEKMAKNCRLSLE